MPLTAPPSDVPPLIGAFQLGSERCGKSSVAATIQAAAADGPLTETRSLVPLRLLYAGVTTGGGGGVPAGPRLAALDTGRAMTVADPPRSRRVLRLIALERGGRGLLLLSAGIH